MPYFALLKNQCVSKYSILLTNHYVFPSHTHWWAFSRADTLLAKLAIFIETAKKHPHAGIAVHRCITCMGILYEITENDNLILPFFTSLSSLLCRCSCGGCSCHSLCRHFSFPQGYRWHPLWLMCQRYWSQCHLI